MGDFVDKHQVRIFFSLAILVIVASIVAVALWGTKPTDWDKIRGISQTVVIAASGFAAAVVVCLVLLSHNYTWWGNAQGCVVYIGIGAILSVVATAFELVNILEPLF